MNYFIFIPVATSVLLLFFGAHYGIYVFLTHFFQVFALHRVITGLTITFLSISFLLSSAVAHRFDNAFSRGWYFASGVWMGTMLNILLAIAVTGIVLYLLRYTSLSLGGPTVAAALLACALLVSAYGVWNALHPRIKEITVTLPNLPDEWKGKKIVQISDIHLGHVYQSGFMRKVVDMINAQDPEVVVITGDLFDGMDGELSSFVSPLDELRANRGVLFVGGNHETYLGTQKTFDILERTRVHILRDEMIDIDGLVFVGIAYPERGERKDIVDVIRGLLPKDSGKPSVLLYHAPVLVEEVAKTGIDLQLSGHTHRGQQFPFQFVTHLVHKGYDYGLYTIGKYHLYVSSGVGTWGPTMRVGTQSEIVVITLE